MLHRFAFITLLHSCALPASAALVCEANIVSLDFGLITDRDGLQQQTSGPVTISCSGGTPRTTVRACLTIGSGSGGSGPSQSPRTMIGDGTAALNYQLTAQNFLSSGGIIWETVSYAIPLNSNGSAMIAPSLYAEVTSMGAQTTIGSYHSHYEPGSDVGISYGETECNQSGATSSFNVSATLIASCTISVSNMDFGVIDTTIVGPVDQTATIDVSCTNASEYTIGIGSGLQPAGDGPTDRRMTNGANVLAYGLYHDQSRTSSWGLSLTNVAIGIGTGSNQSLTVFGRIFSDQQTSVGHYADSVVVTVYY